MTRTHKVQLIEEAIKRHDDLQAAWIPLIKAIRNHDFPAFEESWRVFDAYVKQVEHTLGDAFGSLHWFIFENDCGRKALNVRTSGNENAFPCKTPDDLLNFIEATNT